MFSYTLLRLKSTTNSFNRSPCFLNQESEHGRESDEDLAKLVADLQRRMEHSEVCSFFGKLNNTFRSKHICIFMDMLIRCMLMT